MPMVYDAAARCWRAVNPATIARWAAWRIVHPGWHAPLRTAVEAAIACGKPAALAASIGLGGLRGASVIAPDLQAAREAALAPQFGYAPGHARGGYLARTLSMPPGEPRAVGGSALGTAGTGDLPAAAPVTAMEPPQAVPEPGTPALLAAGALLALLARRAGRGGRGRGVRSRRPGEPDRFGVRIFRIAKLARPAR